MPQLPSQEEIDRIKKLEESGEDDSPEAKVLAEAEEKAKADLKAKEEADAKAAADKKATEEAEAAKAQQDATAKAEADKKATEDTGKPQERPHRPEQYIPVPEHRDKMKAKDEALTVKDQEIATLKSQLDEARKITPGGSAEESWVKEYMEETGSTEKAARLVLKAQQMGTALPKETEERLKRLDEDQRQREADQKARDEKDFHDKEMQTFEGLLKKEYPSATSEAIKIAMEHMEKVAYSEKHRKTTDIGYIFWQERSDFDTLLKTGAPSSGGEQPKVGDGGPKSVTPDDLKTLSDFQKLEDMDPAKRAALIASLPPLKYDLYIRYEQSKENDNGLEITRGIRKVILK